MDAQLCSVMQEHDLTDDQWEIFSEAYSALTKTGRPPEDLRGTINGILFRIREGCRWRAIPPVYGKWMTVYQTFRRWKMDGRWEQIYTAILATDLAKGELNPTDAQVDGTTVRAHPHAAGARRDSKKDIPTSPTTIRWDAPEAAGAVKST